MSTECKQALADAEKKLAYYKEMYEMRTNAYIKLHDEFERVKNNFDLIVSIQNVTIDELVYRAIELGSFK